MHTKLLYLFPLLLIGCSTTQYTKIDSIVKPDPSIMADCIISKQKVKEGDDISDLIQIIVDSQNELKQCSILNQKKKAFINTIMKD